MKNELQLVRESMKEHLVAGALHDVLEMDGKPIFHNPKIKTGDDYFIVDYTGIAKGKYKISVEKVG